jgi:hypothetical protein
LSTKKLKKISICPQDWVTPAEAARVRKVSRQAIGKLIKAGRVEWIDLAGRKLVKLKDIQTFQPQRPGRRKRKSEADVEA